MVQYVIEASSKKGVVWGAMHGGLTLLLVNGGFNFLILGGFKFIPMNFALLDIAVNVIFGVAAGAAIALVSVEPQLRRHGHQANRVNRSRHPSSTSCRWRPKHETTEENWHRHRVGVWTLDVGVHHAVLWGGMDG